MSDVGEAAGPADDDRGLVADGGGGHGRIHDIAGIGGSTGHPGGRAMCSSSAAISHAWRIREIDLALGPSRQVLGQRDDQPDRADPCDLTRCSAVTVATAAGALIAFGVLAMAVGLIRAEAAGDVRTRGRRGPAVRLTRHVVSRQ